MSRKRDGQNLSFKKINKLKSVFTCEKAQFEEPDCFQYHPSRMKPFLLRGHFFTNLKLQLHRCSVNASFSCTLNTAPLSGMCQQYISHFYKLVIIGKLLFRNTFLIMVGEGKQQTNL